MANNCNCPATGALTEIPDQDCDVDFGQIQRQAFQRRPNRFDADADPATDPTKKADWLALKAAVGDTKVIVTPFIGGNPIITPGDNITIGGGDNSTLNGEEIDLGTNPSVFTGDFNSLSSEVKVAMKKLLCEKKLQVYFFNNDGNIIANKVAAGVYEGFPVSNVKLGDRGNAGFGTRDTFAFRYNLKPGWDDNAVILVPEAGFSPLEDL